MRRPWVCLARLAQSASATIAGRRRKYDAVISARMQTGAMNPLRIFLMKILGRMQTQLHAGAAPAAEYDAQLDFLLSPVRETRHVDGDDLLSAGLGRAGLRGAPVVFADPAQPTPEEVRRRAKAPYSRPGTAASAP